MATYEGLSNSVGPIPAVTIKLEEEFLPEDMELQEFIEEDALVQTVRTELEHSHTDVEVKPFSFDSPKREDIKTALVLDDKLQDGKHDSDSAKEHQQHATAISDGQPAAVATKLNKVYESSKHSHTDAGAKLFSLVLDEYIKTELILDEDIPDQKCDKDSSIDDQQHTPAMSDEQPAAVRTKIGKDCEYCGNCKICLSSPMKRTYRCGPRSFKERRSLKLEPVKIKDHNSHSDLDSLIKVHTEDINECEICGARYALELYLERHLLRRHSGKQQRKTPRLQVSDDEPEDTSDEDYLNDESDAESIWSMGSNQRRPNSTGMSLKKSRITWSMENLEQRSADEDDEASPTPGKDEFKCKLCPGAFKRSVDLKRHMITHAKDKKHKFACLLCEKTFFSKSGFYGHMKLHTDDTHNCKMCPGRFPLKSALARHMLRCHSSESPYECLVCKETFKTAYKRKLHKCGKHRQRFKCEFCYKDYSTKSGLRMHTREHTGLPWQCRICEKKMSRKGRCRRHIVEFHKITNKEKAEGFIKEVPINEDPN